MTTACDLVWELAGSPVPSGGWLTDTPGVCAVTGRPERRTADAGRALGTNFVDRSMFRAHSGRVGPAALWCCSGKPPATVRMWSVVAAPGVVLDPSAEKAFLRGRPGLCLTNRANPRPVSKILLAPPPGDWLVTVAVSAQKHVVPYGTVNHGGGRWSVRFEATTISSSPAEFAGVLAAAANLRAAGHRAGDVEAGRPTIAACKTADDLRWWRHNAAALRVFTDSPLLSLSLWCLTKETVNDHTTT